MRRVLLALVLTAVGLGLILSFRSRSISGTTTSLGGSALSGAAGATTGAATPGPSSPGATPSSGSGSASPSASASASPTGSAGSSGSSGAKNGTFTGTAESNPYGNVQVQAVISGGKLTNVNVLQVPDRSGYEDQIVQIAIPELKSEALSAQNANIGRGLRRDVHLAGLR